MDLRDKILTCQSCGRPFLSTARDQQFYAEQGLTYTPGRCPECRAACKTSRGGGQRRGEQIANASHDPLPITKLAAAEVRETHGKNGSAVHSQDISVLRTETEESSYRCEALSAEKAELEREKASLLEKVGLLASERDYLENALAASNGPVPIPDRAEGLPPRPWWKRIFG